jgi:carbapenam-3-carboxylate synthase
MQALIRRIVKPSNKLYTKRLYNSFILGTNQSSFPNEIELMLKTSKPNNFIKTYNIQNYTICLGSIKQITDLNYNYYQNECKTSILIGKITNENELYSIAKSTLLQCDYKHELNEEIMKGVHLIHELYEKYGPSILSLIEGSFTFITLNHSDSNLQVFNDKLGTMPLYYTNQLGSDWIFNEAKIFKSHPSTCLDLKPFTSLNLNNSNSSDFTVFRHINKCPIGYSLLLNKNNGFKINEKFYELKPSYFTLKNKHQIPDFYKNLLNSILNKSVKNSLNDSNKAVLLLSGGLDSSLITSMSKKITPDLTTISVGTHLSDEFKWAKQVSDYVGTKHLELVLSNEQVLDGIINSIYENEIFDGFTAEVQSPLYNLIKYVKTNLNNNNQVLTGYGADLLFGGVIPLNTNTSEVNKILTQQINRTKWTGEFHPFISNKYDINLYHPFWTSNLINYALSLDGSFKKNDHEVKLILREMASQHKYLPDEIAWRKKIGVNEATSVNSVFSQYLGLDKHEKSYLSKSLFVYNLFKNLFEEKKDLNLIDTNDLIKVKSLPITNSMDENLFKCEIKDNIMLIEFNQVNKHNPINEKLETFIKESLLKAEQNDTVNAIIITGGINKSFSAGGDFNEVKNLKTEQEVDAFIQRVYDLYLTSLHVTKPIIGAIDHYAIGIGFQLALTFDIRIGTNRCSFIMPELKYGLSCTIGSCMIEYLFGRNLATKLIYECDALTAQELYDLKLLNKIVEPNDLLNEACNLATKLGKYPKNAFRNTKMATNKRFIKFLKDSIQDSKHAHKKSLLSRENEQHFRNILKDKF